MSTQRRRISIGTTPEEVQVGDTVLLFRPEADVDAGEFLDAYQRLTDAEAALLAEHPNAEQGPADAQLGKKRIAILRAHIAHYLMPEHVDVFNKMKLPLRAINELVRATGEIYGGGRPNGSSPDSAAPRSQPGSTSTPNSPRKAPTRQRGR